MRLQLCLLAAVLLTGCASSSENIGPSYVSSAGYRDLDCQELTEEARWLSRQAALAARAQDKMAHNDAIATGTALVLFWPAAFFISGDGPNATELANLRGHKEAIEEAAIQNDCGFSFRG